ncbi:MAG: histidine kinase [Chromatiaceae bacterium]|nr:histidine kinase [Gammaproteobacteria bacterium]MCP5428112.1 histidine kinase [Chromatiaceae bacterium]MCP5447112.1 histidine kinase [Chromatiaceae bacterium]
MRQAETGIVNDSRKRSFLPDFCSIRMVFALVIGAELLAILLTLAGVESLQGFSTELSMRSLMIQWVALVGISSLCLVRNRLARLSSAQAGAAAWLLILCISLVTALTALWLLREPFYSSRSVAFLVESLGISAIVTALFLRYIYMQHLWRGQVEAESEARFQALQSRIRPHFLFNSMNTIANLTRADPKLAEEVVQDLSDLFRASLSDSRRRSTLGDELELVRGYLRIEGQRLGERLQVVWDLEALPEQAELPALILQPLLENAVYHGIETSSGPGTIHVTGRYRRNKVNISIRNTLPPAESAGLRREGNAMAVENTRQRLQGFFQGESQLTIGEVDGEYQVRVVFPYPWSP